MTEDTTDHVPLRPVRPPESLEERVWALERIVLQMSKFVVVDGSPTSQAAPGIAALMLIEELKQRHPDV